MSEQTRRKPCGCLAKGVRGRGDSRCKGPGVGAALSRSKEAGVAGAGTRRADGEERRAGRWRGPNQARPYEGAGSHIEGRGGGARSPALADVGCEAGRTEQHAAGWLSCRDRQEEGEGGRADPCPSWSEGARPRRAP